MEGTVIVMSDNQVKKVLFIGDQHIWHITPPNRLDVYSEAIIAKMRECLFDIAPSKNVDAIVLLGDLFEKPEPNAIVRNQVLRMFKECTIPIYALEGNHDKDSADDLNKTALGTLFDAGILIRSDYEPSLGIQFWHYTKSLDSEIQSGCMTSSSAIIQCAHASISTELDRFGEYLFLFEKTPLHPNTSLVISGHIHHAMEQVREDNKKFVNPGAISRYASSKDNLEKQIQVYYLEYSLDGTIIDEEYIPLKSARPASEVFRLDEIELNKAHKLETKKLIEKMATITTNNWSHTNIDDKIAFITLEAREAQMNNKSIEIIVDALKYAQEVKKKEKNG